MIRELIWFRKKVAEVRYLMVEGKKGEKVIVSEEEMKERLEMRLISVAEKKLECVTKHRDG